MIEKQVFFLDIIGRGEAFSKHRFQVHPIFAKMRGPTLGAIVSAQFIHLMAQAAHLRYTVQGLCASSSAV